MKEFIRKYKHAIPMLVYAAIYLICFALVEHFVKDDFHLIHVGIDDKIPFCEVFVIPYFMWFGYVLGFMIYFIFFDKESYWPVFWYLVIGMTLFIIVSAVYPNGHNLRPTEFPRDNVFTRLIAGLYKTDTATNILPSIHVYNSLAIQAAVMNSRKLSKHRVVQGLSAILCLLIILSTMFIKQHSFVDVISAVILGAVVYVVIYIFCAKKRKTEKNAE